MHGKGAAARLSLGLREISCIPTGEDLQKAEAAPSCKRCTGMETAGLERRVQEGRDISKQQERGKGMCKGMVQSLGCGREAGETQVCMERGKSRTTHAFI